MSQYGRYFPVSHDINRDPEVWQMRDEIGEKALSIWFELLSIADRNNGFLISPHANETSTGPVYESLVSSVSYGCRSNKTKVRSVFEFALSHVWLVFDPTLRVRNYAKYHRYHNTNFESTQPHIGGPPNLPILPNLPKDINNNHEAVQVSVQKGEKKEWPAEGQFVKDFLDSQGQEYLSPYYPNGKLGTLDDPVWWENVAESINGLTTEFLNREFARIGAWFSENPGRLPTERGLRRFIRGWLDKAYEEERRKAWHTVGTEKKG